MDLESWTPKDKARRLAVLIAIYVAMMVLMLSWLALGWPWYLVPFVAIASYFLVFYTAYAVLRQYFRR